MSEAERSILGGILLDSKAYDEAASIGLLPEDFAMDSHRRIYRSIVALAESSAAIDTVTLINYLDTHRELKAIGDVGYVSSLTDGVPDRPSIKSYVRIVKEAAAKKKIGLAVISVNDGLQEGMTSGDAIEFLTDQMLQVQTGSDEAPARRVIEFSEATYTKWRELANSTGEIVGLSTGVGCVDTATTGIRPGELWVYGGRTGGGKTNLALQTAAASCEQEIPVAYFAIEPTKEEILERLWAGESRVNYGDIRFPRHLPADTTHRIEQAMVQVAKWPLFVVEESGIQLSKLMAKARLLIRREKVQLIVIDYIQKVNTNAKDERGRVSKVSNVVTKLAKDTGVPVIALSQLSRPKDGNENYRPTMYHLKETGDLENDSHVVILIYRPLDDHGQRTGEDELIIGKQRGGMMSVERVRFTNFLRFRQRHMQ